MTDERPPTVNVWTVKTLLTFVTLLLMMATPAPLYAQDPLPDGEPIPEFDYGDQSKTMVVCLEFVEDGSVSFLSSEVVIGPPRARFADPPMLRVQVFDDTGNPVETFNAWDPRLVETFDIVSGYGGELLPRATGRFIFPFAPNLKAVQVVDIPRNRAFRPFDVRSGIRTFCEQNPQDSDCVSDLVITKTDSVDPAVAGETLDYTIVVTNNGPNPAHAVQVVDLLPPGVSNLRDNAGCVAGPVGMLTCNLGILTSGETRVIEITVMVDAALVHNAGVPIAITDQASVSNQAGTETAPDDNNVSEDTQVVAVADLEIVSFEALNVPSEVLVGTDLLISLRKIITNRGPSAPMHTVRTITAVAPADSTVTPPVSAGQELALGLNEQREVSEAVTLNCGQASQHTFVITNVLRPLNAADTDLALSNNEAELTLNIECVVPVAVDIRSGQINLRSRGVVPVLVFNNEAGENGLPLAFDASRIDPLSVRFGPRDVIWNEAGGAAEAHNQGHGHGLLLHFVAAETGLVSGNTEACLKGIWIDASHNAHKFFGCDSVRVTGP